MEQFRMDNTDGYAQEQLDTMNEEFESEMSFCEYDAGSWEYDSYEKSAAEKICNQ